MSQAATVLKLLGKLKSGGSYFSRMKMISQLWESFSNLSPKNRTKLLMDLGLEGAEAVLEKFLSNPGTYYFEILELANTALNKLSPEQLEKLSKGHLSSSESEMLLTAVRESVVDEVKEKSPPPRPPIPLEPLPDLKETISVPETDKDTEQTRDRLPERKSKKTEPIQKDRMSSVTEITGAAAAATLASTYSVSKGIKSDSGPKADEGTTSKPKDIRAEKVSSPAKEAAISELKQKPIVEKSIVFEAENLEYSWEPPKNQPKSDSPEPLSHSIQVPDERYRDESPSQMYRNLSRDSDAMKTWTTDELSSILDRLPPGWMRRRLLSRYLSELSKQPSDSISSDLINLMKENTLRPTDYLWFVSAVVRDIEPTQTTIDRILDSSPNAVIKRRVERLLESVSNL